MNKKITDLVPKNEFWVQKYLFGVSLIVVFCGFTAILIKDKPTPETKRHYEISKTPEKIYIKTESEIKIEKNGNNELFEKERLYIKRFSKVAQSEMQKFGIPASITLAQGLIESNAGGSRLSTRNNNHFGMKCFSRKCKKGHCSNFTDDSHKDFFMAYKTPWQSYRAHSEMLYNNIRYRALFKLHPKDYKGWAKGLKKCGYATSLTYAEKLIDIIERHGLYNFDN